MLDIININFLDACMGLEPVVRIVKAVVTLIQWGVPILLIVFGMLDLGKAVMAGKEDEMKKAQGILIKRVIYAVAVFLVVTLVVFIMNIVGNSKAEGTDNVGGNGASWWKCWDSVGSAI